MCRFLNATGVKYCNEDNKIAYFLKLTISILIEFVQLSVDDSFYEQCKLGWEPQKREIGFPISTDNAIYV